MTGLTATGTLSSTGVIPVAMAALTALSQAGFAITAAALIPAFPRQYQALSAVLAGLARTRALRDTRILTAHGQALLIALMAAVTEHA